MRLNPRQRWHEGVGNSFGYKGGSTVAGVPAVMWGAFLASAVRHNSTTPKRLSTPHDRAMNQGYYASQDRFRKDLQEALLQLDAHPHEWIEVGVLKMRVGRGKGPDVEVTVVSKAYDDMRSFLTMASLGITDQYRQDKLADMSKWDTLLNAVLKMLYDSSDRRPYNRYTYKDLTYAECGKLGVSRRLERTKSNRKFRKQLEEMFAEMAAKRRAAKKMVL